jgi:hypothetical protein
LSTVIPQIGSFVVDVVFFMVISLRLSSWLGCVHS